MYPIKATKYCRKSLPDSAAKFSKGTTLTELIIYIAIASIVFGIVISVYVFFGKTYRKASSSYDLQSETQTALQWLRKDLTQTGISSITVYPNNDHPNEPAGVSFISAVDPLDKPSKGGVPQFNMSRYGVPLWRKYVFYTIIPNSFDASNNFTPRTGRLVRWENEITGYHPLPSPTSVLPSQHNLNPKSVRTIISSVMMPGDPKMKGFDSLYMKNGDFKENETGAAMWDCGGFRTAFVRRKNEGGNLIDYLNCQNPSQVSDEGTILTNTTTGLIQTDIIVLVINPESGQPSAFSLTMQNTPRN